jgi:spore coat polysaccharide biosynthesis protein SpsF
MLKLRIGCIILARYNSSRLHGKALREIGGKALLHRIHDTLRDIFPDCQLVVATSEEESDKPIAEYCEEHQINCFRGSLNHVAERFYRCAMAYDLDYAFRINGDNLFVATDCVQEMMEAVRQDTSLDFLSNVKDRTFPFGMSVELLKIHFYEKVLEKIGKDARYQEHVTLYLYEHEALGKRKYFYNEKYPEAKGAHLAIDTPEDFEIARRMLEKMPDYRPLPALNELIHYYEAAKNEYKVSLER